MNVSSALTSLCLFRDVFVPPHTIVLDEIQELAAFDNNRKPNSIKSLYSICRIAILISALDHHDILYLYSPLFLYGAVRRGQK